MTLNVTPLTPTIGARVDGIDARNPQPDDIEQLKQLLAENCVLHLPGQSLLPAEQERFASHFAELWIGSFLKPIEGHDFAIPILNRGKSLAISERWHADSTYDAFPPYQSFLNAIDTPPIGGDTMWCNQYLVYEYLPAGIKKLIKSLKAVHYNRGQVKVRTGENREDLPGYAHPLVIKHPVTGRPVFYLSAHAEHLEGVSREESRAILDELRKYNGQPAFSYRHRWTRGDLMIWDNRCATHYAIHDYTDYPRYLTRVTTAGPRPEAYFPEADNQE